MGREPGAPDAPLLSVRGLRTYFHTEDGVVPAVDGVSFDLPAGGTLGIVGESGCGKSVTALTVLRLVVSPPGRIESGRILFEGQDLLRFPEARMREIRGNEISMIFQEPMSSLNPVFSVGFQIAENIIQHQRLRKREAYGRAVEMLELVGIPAPEKRVRDYPHEMSGGMRQRVMIAIALACGPRLLIADEPTTALDVTVQKQILDLLDRLRRRHRMAMILITHDLSVVAGRTDDVVVMYAGRIVEKAPTVRLFTAMRHPYTKALFESIPKVTRPSHTRLQIIHGHPPDLATLPPGCAFAPRCTHAQPRCLSESPPLGGGDGGGHAFACYYPSGTAEGEAALAANRAAGRTVTGLTIGPRPPGPDPETT